MSVPMRKHPISGDGHQGQKHNVSLLYVVDNNVTYAIPKAVAKQYVIKPKKSVHKLGNVAADDVFAELDEKCTKAGALLRGLRARENLSQVEFAKKIKITQANLSKLENGKRAIGRTIAKRIEKAFNVNYRYFLA